eukprot:CAMPEP_0168499964 /NCGR_PEP_ID=MMETSP0228-20121227/74045_1 /TAXON_ID=133427 /ORGANISM="Protoceratium reticulatum, Strain CCCM 535 (=CCMP 1889)" /LENGTH=130 /DNA_ID=CAMNT_0008516873 /DNA_START=12 /DNA_END=401 /DNA_ORIENTATION=+
MRKASHRKRPAPEAPSEETESSRLQEFSRLLSGATPFAGGRVPVFVMLPPDWMSDDAKAVRHPERLRAQLQLLKVAGARGVMANIWWGLCESEPWQHEFSAVRALCELLSEQGLKLQAALAFHACGGSMG